MNQIETEQKGQSPIETLTLASLSLSLPLSVNPKFGRAEQNTIEANMKRQEE
jgi:hypothetical protein